MKDMKELKFINSTKKFIETWNTMDDETRFRLLKKIENNPIYPDFNIKINDEKIYVQLEDGIILEFNDYNNLLISAIKAIGIHNINLKEKKIK